MRTTDPRRVLADLFEVAVGAVRGDRVLRAASRVEQGRWIYEGPGGRFEMPLPSRGSGRVFVTGAGKAAASLARGLEDVLGDRIDDGLVIVKHGHVEPLQFVRTREADHPVPGEASLSATRELVQLLESTQPHDAVFFLLTGGASSLLCLPVAGITLPEKALTSRLLINCGATIEEINLVRRHLSCVKGGRLRRRSAAQAFCTLSISDVIGEDPATIGSGPTVRDATTGKDALAVLERYGLLPESPGSVLTQLRRGAEAPALMPPSAYRVIGSNRMALDACVREALARGYEVSVLTDRMMGHTHAAARSFAEAVRDATQRRVRSSAPTLLLAGGETTLAVAGPGMGGRNQEFATVAALHLQGIERATLLAAGTDGTDGPTQAAGAFADGSSVARAQAAGLDIHEHLRRNDTHPLLAALGDLFVTGPTGTNVMDLVLAIVR